MKTWSMVGVAAGALCAWMNLVAAENSPGAVASPALAALPSRILYACDFESPAAEEWWGQTETNHVAAYPGNRTALRAVAVPGQKSGVAAGLKLGSGIPTGPGMTLSFRYFVEGTGTLRVEWIERSKPNEPNGSDGPSRPPQRVELTGLATGRWSRHSVSLPSTGAESLGNIRFLAQSSDAGNAGELSLRIDDVILFASVPVAPGATAPFPERVILLATFDPAARTRQWPGDFTVADRPPEGAFHWAGASVPKPGYGQMIVLPIQPPKPVGARTRIQFRYFLTQPAEVTLQIFDATVQDNRHIVLRDLRVNQWTTAHHDFNREAQRNDGTPDRTFPAGHLVDDIFFFVRAPSGQPPLLFLDDVVLFDSGVALPPRE